MAAIPCRAGQAHNTLEPEMSTERKSWILLAQLLGLRNTLLGFQMGQRTDRSAKHYVPLWPAACGKHHPGFSDRAAHGPVGHTASGKHHPGYSERAGHGESSRPRRLRDTILGIQKGQGTDGSAKWCDPLVRAVWESPSWVFR